VVGRNIARRRRARRLTQAALAAAVGLGRTAAVRWELGERLPPLPTLARLAGALGCEPAELVAGVRPVAPLPITAAARADEEE
jgi:transcriptional regulator with XRE-family HTH domain